MPANRRVIVGAVAAMVVLLAAVIIGVQTGRDKLFGLIPSLPSNLPSLPSLDLNLLSPIPMPTLSIGLPTLVPMPTLGPILPGSQAKPTSTPSGAGASGTTASPTPVGTGGTPTPTQGASAQPTSAFQLPTMAPLRTLPPLSRGPRPSFDGP